MNHEPLQLFGSFQLSPDGTGIEDRKLLRIKFSLLWATTKDSYGTQKPLYLKNIPENF